MRYLALLLISAALTVILPGATGWKLVLKDGKTIDCDAVPVIVNDVYLFRDVAGREGTLAADQVDREQTDRLNKVAPPPLKWTLIGQSMIGQSIRQPALEGVTDWDDTDFDAEVIQSSTPVLVDFWATWCGYCKKIAPTVDAVASEFVGRLKVGKVDIDRSPATARRYGIHFTPTLLIFDKGRVVATMEGAAGKAAVVRMLQSHL
jgi:thioredoxin 1